MKKTSKTVKIDKIIRKAAKTAVGMLEKPASACFGAVVAAGGISSRFGEGDKLMSPICGTPVLVHTLLALEKCPDIACIVVSAGAERLASYADLAARYGITKLKAVTEGGKTRAESVFKGLAALPENVTHAVIQDGARPLTTPELISEVCAASLQGGSAIACSRVTNTIKTVENGYITSTVDRSSLAAAMTPQVFDLSLIKGALADAIEKQIPITDDAMALERLGIGPKVVFAGDDNIKITSASDIAVAEALMERRK